MATVREVFDSGDFDGWLITNPRFVVSHVTVGVVTVQPFIDPTEAYQASLGWQAKGYPVTVCNLDSYLTHSA